jgi:hypothetical protein
MQKVVRRNGHSPTLETQMMVEKCIRDNTAFPSRRALMRALPRKVEYPTLVKILNYLEASDKILLNGDSVTWIFVDNPKLVKLLRESPVLRSGDTPSSRRT